MKITVRWIKLMSVSLLAGLLAGCLTTTSTKVVHQQIPLDTTYHNIVASGPVQIQLVREPARTPLTITGWPESVARTKAWTLGDTLYLSNAWVTPLVPGMTIITVPVGDAQNLKVNLSDQAIMQAQYLTFANIDVKTSDVAHAQVFATDNLKIKAKDNSSVFYYGHPRCVRIERPGKTAEIQHFNTLKG